MHPHAVMCHVAPDLASLLRRAHTLPRVLQPRTSPLYRGGLRRYHMSCSSRPRLLVEVSSSGTMRPTAPNPAPYQGGIQRCHLSRGSGPHLLVEVGSGAATCPSAPDPASPQGRAPALSRASRLQTLPSRGESSGAAMCPTALSTLYTMGIKKSLAALGT
jgi:hypothetical protein